MSDFDSQLSIKTTALQSTVEIANASAVTINPATEDGNLASIKTDSDTIVTNTNNLSGIKTDTDSLASTVSSGRLLVTTQTDATINLDKIAGTTPDTNTGNSSAGTLRVVLASNQPAINVNVGGGNTPVFTYSTTASVATNGTATNSVAGPVFLDQVLASASGQMKVVVAIGTTGSEATKYIGFTSKGDLNFKWTLVDFDTIPTGQSVKVTLTNLDNQSMDVYSTIVTH